MEAINAAQESPSVLGRALVSFLDNDVLRVGVVGHGEGGALLDDPTNETDEVDKERESFDQLGKAVGELF